MMMLLGHEYSAAMFVNFLHIITIDKTAIHWCPRERSLLEWKTN